MDFRLSPAEKPATFSFMGSLSRLQTKTIGVLGSCALLAAVGCADYLTGYELSLAAFYLLPILFALRFAETECAFALAVAAPLVSQITDFASGKHYSDYLTPIWNIGIRTSIYVLVVILFSARNHLKNLVEQRTEKLRQEISERSRLEKELLEIAESEQRRIGHDLHDSLGQHLTATALAGKLLAKKLAGNAPVDPMLANRVVVLIEEAIELTRNLARTLHPIELGADGLEDALQNLAANLSKSFNVACRFQVLGAVVLRDPKAGVHLYRIAQESASNAIRHGRARNILISLDAARKSVMLAVTDDGTGLPADARTKKGMGLRIMEYRADMIGATFDIQNLPAGGARAICVLDPPEEQRK
jgi:signal transduction histidine kinase